MVMHELRCQDRKSTRLNSNLHSFPTRRSSDLASGLRGPASWGQRVAREGKLTRTAQRRANGYARIKVPGTSRGQAVGAVVDPDRWDQNVVRGLVPCRGGRRGTSPQTTCPDPRNDLV